MNLFLVVWQSRDESGEFASIVTVAPAAFLSEESAHIYGESNLALAPAEAFQVVAVGVDVQSIQESLAQQAVQAMEEILRSVAALEARVAAIEGRG